MGEESALIDLGLQGNQEASFIPHKSQPTMETLTAEYSHAKKVALVANILEVSLLENLSMKLMFLDLVASLLYKTHLLWKLAIVMLGALYRFGFITSRTGVRTFEIFTEM